MCMAMCGDRLAWIYLGNVQPVESTGCVLYSPACNTPEECLQREFCVLTGLHENAPFTQSTPNTGAWSRCFYRSDLLAFHCKSRPALKKEELLAGNKAPSIRNSSGKDALKNPLTVGRILNPRTAKS